MKRSFWIIVVTACSIIACRETRDSMAKQAAVPVTPVSPNTMLAGRISVSGSGAGRAVALRDDDGDRYQLTGDAITALASLDGASVLAFGVWDADTGFLVREFQVVAMRGRSALDGILEVSKEGFALRLANGTIRFVPGLKECADYVGQRLWVTGWDAASDLQFGLIGAA